MSDDDDYPSMAEPNHIWDDDYPERMEEFYQQQERDEETEYWMEKAGGPGYELPRRLYRGESVMPMKTVQVASQVQWIKGKNRHVHAEIKAAEAAARVKAEAEARAQEQARRLAEAEAEKKRSGLLGWLRRPLLKK